MGYWTGVALNRRQASASLASPPAGLLEGDSVPSVPLTWGTSGDCTSDTLIHSNLEYAISEALRNVSKPCQMPETVDSSRVQKVAVS